MPMFYTESGFLKAIANGDTALVEKYFAHNTQAKWMAVRGAGGVAPLHVAAHGNSAPMIALLLRAGADLEEKNGDGLTPLAVATVNRSMITMRALAEAGADTSVTTQFGTLLQTAAAYYFETGFHYLLEKGAAPTDEAFRETMRRNYHDMAQALLKAGLAPASENLSEFLIAATKNGHIELMKALLDKGAQAGAADADGNTPLHHAAYYGKPEAAALLISKGARFDVRDNQGETPAQKANRWGDHTPIVRMFRKMEEDQLAKTATPLNASKTRMPGDSAETWVLMGENKVAHVGVYPAVGRRLTHIFNFESRERLIISENLKTGQEAVTPPEKFDTLEPAHLEKALAAFRENGGKADDAAVFGKALSKKPLAGPG